MPENKNFITLLLLVHLLGAASCYAQKNNRLSDEIIVQAKVWSKDEFKQVHYSDWKNYPSITLEMLKGFEIKKPGNLDKYGSIADIQKKATGFFRTEKLGDRWWIIDPIGHPFLVSAVNSLRLGKSSNNDAALSQNFGSVQNWIATTIDSLRLAGFNTAGSWSDTAAIISYNKTSATPFPYTTQLNLLSRYSSIAKKNDKSRKGNNVLSFILDNEFAAYCELQTSELISLKNDPNLLGHFSDNELPFTHTSFKEIMNVEDKTDKCYIAAKEWMKSNGIDETSISREQKEVFIGWLAGKYFETVSSAIKKNDPNHLFIGSRLHSSAKNNESIFKAAEPFVDIVSINYYGEWAPKADHLKQWTSWSAKPFFITEFYTKAEETDMSNLSGAGWIVHTQADRGIHYQNFCIKLLQEKNCVGWHWFRYQDNDPADASADESNKDSNKGIVNTQYQFYRDLIDKMKQLNDNKYSLIKFFDSIK